MASETTTTVQKVLKYFHGPKMAEAVPDKVFFLKTAQDRSDLVRWGGRDATMLFPVNTKLGWGTGAHSEGGDFGTPRAKGYDEYSVGITRLDVDGEISDQLIKLTRSRPELSYIGSALEDKMDDLMKVARKLLGILIFGDGTGALCQVTTTPGAITATQFYVDNPGGEHLEEGMFISARDDRTVGGSSAEQLTAGAQEILGLSYDPATGYWLVTITDTTSLANDDDIFLVGHYGKAHPMGIWGHVDDGTQVATYQGLTRAAKSYTKAHMVTTTEDLSESVLYQVFRILAQFAPANDTADVVLTDNRSLESLANSVLDRQRFEGTDVTGGFTTVKYATPWGTKKIVNDPLAPAGRIRCLRMADFAFGWAGKKGGQWFDEDGDVLKPKVSSTSGTGYAAAWVMTWLMYVQFVCSNPRNQADLTGYGY